jgi:hypothetical protein
MFWWLFHLLKIDDRQRSTKAARLELTVVSGVLLCNLNVGPFGQGIDLKHPALELIMASQVPILLVLTVCGNGNIIMPV